MKSISLKTKVDADGKISLQLPLELADRELDLVIVYQSARQHDIEELRSTVDSFYGCLKDDPILEEERKKTA